MGNMNSNAINLKALVLLLLAGSIVGLGPVVAKLINAPAMVIVLYRITLPIPIFYIIGKFKHNIKDSSISKRKYSKDVIIMMIIGILFALDLTTFYISLKFTKVTSATLLSNISPIFLAIYSIICKKKITRDIFWPCFSMIGLYLLCGSGRAYSNNELIGYLFALSAAFFFSGYILLVNKVGYYYSSVAVMFWSSLGGSIFLLALCLFLKLNITIETLGSFSLVLFLSYGTQLVGQTLLTKAISIFPPHFSSLGILIDPVSAAIFAWLILDEKLTSLEMIGAMIVLISIFLAYKYREDGKNDSQSQEIINV